MKTKNGKHLKVKALVDLGCTHMGIGKQLVKEKRIQIRSINFSFEVFNMDGTKNREVRRIVPLEVEINRHKEQVEVTVMALNGTDMFLGHNWLVKHNPEVNCKDRKIWFMRCPGSCRMKHKDIEFKIRRIQTTKNMDKDNREIGKKLDTTNPEDLPDYI